jgi:HAE1 family hydrophobic/amphiphilic exporter-1
MLPIALGRGDGAAARASLATVVVGGQAMCLLITLLVTPVVYSFFDDFHGLRGIKVSDWRVVQWARARAATAASVAVALWNTLGK